MLTTQAQVRAAFWEAYPNFKRRGNATQNEYPADVRVTFVYFVDALCRNGEISERLAERVTL